MIHTHTISFPQAILGEYMHAQMAFHAKALELHTIAYQNLHSINEEEEIQVRCLASFSSIDSILLTLQAFRQGLHPQKKKHSTATAPDGSLHRTGSDPSLSGSMHRSELY